MAVVRIAPIVEGDGEVMAVPRLLRRIEKELIAGVSFDVLRPWRLKRGYVFPFRDQKVGEALKVSALNLLRHPAPASKSAILVLMDRDPNPEPTCRLGPRLLDNVRRVADPRVPVTCVLADVEFESWFVAAADSLSKYLEFHEERGTKSVTGEKPKGKSWIERHFKNHRYSETVDQIELTKAMDLRLCRQYSPSFDKLCRELERLV